MIGPTHETKQAATAPSPHKAPLPQAGSRPTQNEHERHHPSECGRKALRNDSRNTLRRPQLHARQEVSIRIPTSLRPRKSTGRRSSIDRSGQFQACAGIPSQWMQGRDRSAGGSREVDKGRRGLLRPGGLILRGLETWPGRCDQAECRWDDFHYQPQDTLCRNRLSACRRSFQFGIDVLLFPRNRWSLFFGLKP